MVSDGPLPLGDLVALIGAAYLGGQALTDAVKYVVREAERRGGGISEGGELSEEEAAERVAEGGDVAADTKEEAEKVARGAGGGQDPVQDSPHNKNPDGTPRPGDYRPHYHTSDRKGGHVFYPDNK